MPSLNLGLGRAIRLAFWILVSSSLVHAGPILYTVIDLGVIPGGFGSAGIVVNNLGQVIGSSDSPAGSRAVVWDPVGGMQVLDLLPGRVQAFGTGINDAGSVVGYTVGASFDATGFQWNSVDGTQPQPPVGFNEPYGINSSGQVSGWATGPTFTRAAYFWDPVNGTQYPAFLPGDGQGFGFGINNLGQVTGYSQPAMGGATHAFVWDPINGTQPLGTLPGGISSTGLGINNLGQVSGEADAGSNVHAFFWDPVSGMQDLGNLPNRQESHGRAINDLGQVVGSSQFPGQQHAFLWTGNVLLDLNDLLINGDGWTLQQANSISNTGYITGYGVHNGESRGFLLVPVSDVPEPAAWLLGFSGLVALGVSRKRATANANRKKRQQDHVL